MKSHHDVQFVGRLSPTAPQAGHGSHPCQGLYYTPRNQRPRIAMIASHYSVDFMEHYLAPYACERGYGFLGWNTRFRGADELFVLEHALVDVGVGVRWLKEEAGVDTVLVLGNSGGSSLLAAYQAQATKPTMANEHEGVLKDALGSFIKGDAFVSLNAHLGRPEVMTDWMDASVVDEFDPTKTDAALDPFNPDNGPPYSAEFVERYRKAQRARNQRITEWVKAEKARLAEFNIPDRIFSLARMWGDLRTMDPTLDPSERKTPGCYRGNPPQANKGFGVGRACSLTAWLSMWSLETSRCQASEHLPRIDVPSLVVQGLADEGVFPSDARRIFDLMGAADKQIQMVPGAHYFEESEAVRRHAATVVFDWVDSRFKHHSS